MTMKKIALFQTVVLVVATVWGLSACTTAQRVNQGSVVATRGVQLTEILPVFYDAYYRLAIRADSVVLQFGRQQPGVSADTLRKRLQDSNTALRETGKLVTGMKDHVALLRKYFVAIRNLTDEGLGKNVGASTQQLIEGMVSVREAFSGKDLVAAPVERAGKQAGNFVVVGLKSEALQKELEAHGTTIDAELDLQEMVLGELGESMAGNQQLWVSAGLEAPLLDNYANKRQKLSWRWIDNRIELLTQPEDFAITTTARDAMADLRKAWSELASGGPEQSTLIRLQNRINATRQLLEALAN